jgi:ABC-2 type transport system ATP-binding protein
MTREATAAIDATGLGKAFGATRALDGIDLHVPAGTIYGFLGPNGAGKTTAIRILATLLRPDEGSARIFGADVVREAEAVRRRVSLTGQFASVDLELTGRENLLLLGRLLGYSRRWARRRADELLGAFGLADAGGRLVKSYSGGIRRRLDIAASLVVAPDLLFLDEPTTGLDPASRGEVWGVVRQLAAGGSTVLLTTQYLDEADRLADGIAVIDHGRVIAEGTPRQLKASVGSGVLTVELAEAARRGEAELILGSRLDGSAALETAERAVLACRVADEAAIPSALAELVSAGIRLTSFSLGQPSLDEAFLALTGHRADPANDENVREAA